MANWYVDSSATGTGSGDTAANAATDIGSLLIGGQVNWGDFVWVRKTHVEAKSGSHTYGRSGWNVLSHDFINVVGWPSVGDPWHNMRPGDARSAGWDADSSFHFGNIAYPSLVGSATGTGFGDHHQFRDGNNLSNFLMVSSVANGTFNRNFSESQYSTKYNIHALSIHPSLTTKAIRQLTMTFSYNTTNIDAMFDADVVNLDMLTITESTCFNDALFNCGHEINVGRVNVLTSSLGYLFSPYDNTTTERIKSILSIAGQKPCLAEWNGVAAAFYIQASGVGIDDYYGEGHKFSFPISGINQLQAAQAAAVYSGSPVQITEIASAAIGTNFNSHRSFQEGIARSMLLQNIVVTSGTPLVARLPIWINGIGSGDLYAGNFMMSLLCQGGGNQLVNVVNSTFIPGSAGYWSGNSLAAGSAYIAECRWTPTVTGSAFLLFRCGQLLMNSGYVAHPMFFEISS